MSDDDENDLDDESSGEVSPSELGAGEDKESDIPVTSDLTKTDLLLDGLPDFNSQGLRPQCYIICTCTVADHWMSNTVVVGIV